MEHSRSLSEVAVDVMRQTVALLHTEASLARAEISENLETIAGGLAMLIAGATLIIPALVLILEAAAAAVTAAGLAEYWSLAIFGGGAFILGIVLALIGRRRLRISTLKPRKTLDQLSRDAVLAKEQMGTANDKTQRAA